MNSGLIPAFLRDFSNSSSKCWAYFFPFSKGLGISLTGIPIYCSYFSWLEILIGTFLNLS